MARKAGTYRAARRNAMRADKAAGGIRYWRFLDHYRDMKPFGDWQRRRMWPSVMRRLSKYLPVAFQRNKKEAA